jgi:hypothetical protein
MGCTWPLRLVYLAIFAAIFLAATSLQETLFNEWSTMRGGGAEAETTRRLVTFWKDATAAGFLALNIQPLWGNGLPVLSSVLLVIHHIQRSTSAISKAPHLSYLQPMSALVGVVLHVFGERHQPVPATPEAFFRASTMGHVAALAVLSISGLLPDVGQSRPSRLATIVFLSVVVVVAGLHTFVLVDPGYVLGAAALVAAPGVSGPGAYWRLATQCGVLLAATLIIHEWGVPVLHGALAVSQLCFAALVFYSIEKPRGKGL